ncbi:uncharacterized protein TNCV_5141591 [Trichonephila clavipes]|nr:uncharacterized protein TNCV_5141591 [Trichonephila clavipes]
MEAVGATRIFQRSIVKRGLKYAHYYGDGDSKGFISVKDTYGKDSVTKYECIGHVQKRVGARLRKLKSKNKNLSDTSKSAKCGNKANAKEVIMEGSKNVPVLLLTGKLNRDVRLPCNYCNEKIGISGRKWRKKNLHGNVSDVVLDMHDNPSKNRIFVNSDHSLFIKKVQKEDGGYYFCYDIEDIHGKAKMDILLDDDLETEVAKWSKPCEKLIPCTRDLAHKTFVPTDLARTYSVCTRSLFGGTGIEPRPSDPESGAFRGFQEYNEDIETRMACDAEDCGFQMLNDNYSATSVQEESDPVDDETDEEEDNNNNESSNGPSNADAFSALETAMECIPEVSSFECYPEWSAWSKCDKCDQIGQRKRVGECRLQRFVKAKMETILEAKPEEFVDDALIYAKSLCEELENSFEPPRRIRRKHIFSDQLSYEDDLRRTMFSSIDRVSAEIRERFQQLQNLAQKFAFLRVEMI